VLVQQPAGVDLSNDTSFCAGSSIFVDAGIPNPIQGKKRPQYIVDAIIKARKESKGKWYWITNGSVNKKIRKTDEVPNGFRPGRDPSFLIKNK